MADELLDRIEQLVLEAESATRPMEVDPYRGQLFELFVTAHGAGLLDDDVEDVLSSEAICRELARRWGLTDAAKTWLEAQSPLPREQMSKMRLIWSVMRMWMEWDYAWSRWPEFNGEEDADDAPSD